MPRQSEPPLITPTQLAAAMAGVGLNRLKLAAELDIHIRSVMRFIQGKAPSPSWLAAAVRLLAARGVFFGPCDGVSFGANAFGDQAVRIPDAKVGGRRWASGDITPDELRAALESIGMTQGELAKRVGASGTSVSLFLAGKRSGATWLAEAAREIGGRDSSCTLTSSSSPAK